ncbi:hypothetical protein CE91St46_11110 [Eubacteriales bacterium]|nr:hypothetical protein CE91St46_11110 [Eubacteriales bacterium]GKH62636.1 hypothetical protein CE91St47_11050 [Eubacteriales bacterium]
MAVSAPPETAPAQAGPETGPKPKAAFVSKEEPAAKSICCLDGRCGGASLFVRGLYPDQRRPQSPFQKS